ncbi:DUF4132 domain-containing protein [Glycomyces buryatensis]|uniref:DUF4132 domain-containing protein n=1 Tax=Glycomyces buryatensis TaxID=2570927 RepID=A0A4V6T6M6_9ACTN|nr:DUF4132 domain-containing protein [Glycomyces buryatensis]THV38506.1 DUF4132 domain-containing protein [Glycomyces buryatensis]
MTKLPDETLLDLPTGWGTLAPEPVAAEADPTAPQQVRQWIEEHRADLRFALNSPDNFEYEQPGRDYMDGKPDPLGAAVVAELLGSYCQDQGSTNLAIDAWRIEHGLEFAAAALVAGAGVCAWRRPQWTRTSNARVYERDAKILNDGLCSTVAGRFRDRTRTAALLAAIEQCGDAEYDRVRAAVEEQRTTPVRRLIAALLLPREGDWMLEACAEYPVQAGATDGGLWPFIKTVEQLDALSSKALLPTYVSMMTLGTLLSNLETASLPALTATLGQSFAFGGTHGHNKNGPDWVLQAIAMVPTDEAVNYLIARLDSPRAFNAACEAARRFPVRSLRLAAATSATADREVRRRLAGFIDAIDPALFEAALVSLSDDERTEIRRIVDRVDWVPDANPEDLPGPLAEPPWAAKKPANKRQAVLELEAEDQTVLEWLEGEQEEWANLEPSYWPNGSASHDWAGALESNLAPGEGRLGGNVVAFAPLPLARRMLDEWNHPYRISYNMDTAPRALARFGEDVMDDVIASVEKDRGLCDVLLPLENLAIARMVAEWHSKLKSMRPQAGRWLDQHQEGAARLLIPDAVGKRGRRRTTAEKTLAHLARTVGAQVVTQAAERYGPEALEAVQPILAEAATEGSEIKPPKVGSWAIPALLPQVLLVDSERALPDASVRHLMSILALGDGRYLDVIAQQCDPASLAAFCNALFAQWIDSGGDSKDMWVLDRLGRFGNAETVRALAPLILTWPGQSFHERSIRALKVLRSIGTEEALREMHRVSLRCKYQGVRDHAEEMVAAVASDLGLTGEQLADRLVPDLGLGEDASLVLDYGPRQFKVGFDEQLKPFVQDSDGKPRKSLPKPGAKDDAEVAEASRKRFSLLKKELRTAASDLVKRLERAMVEDRTWTRAEFDASFVNHPLVWHLTRRLVWTAEMNGKRFAFRVAEDRSFADAEDEVLEVPQDAVIRLPHPLRFDGDVDKWGETLADYEILQPFEQLSRPSYAFTAEELETGRLTRFEKAEVPVGALIGLTSAGWDRMLPEDGGVEPGMFKELGHAGYLVIHLDPGIWVGAISECPDQTLEAVFLTHSRPSAYDLQFDLDSFRGNRIDPVEASEILASLSKITKTA